MQTTLKPFLKRLIERYEGGYVWDKADPGGPTKYGVTAAALADHRGKKMSSMSDWVDDVKALTIAEASEIYEEKYAKPVGYASLPAGLDTCVLDYAVNSGVGRANRVLRALLDMPPGTTCSPEMIARVRKSPVELIEAMCDERLRFMKSIRGGTAWERYGKGWGTRVADLREYSLALAGGQKPGQPPDLSTVPTPKAEVPKPGKTGEATGSTIGGVLTTVLGYLTDLPWGWIAGGVVAIVVIFVVVGVYRDLKAENAEAKVHI